jgi:hypothetical protein
MNEIMNEILSHIRLYSFSRYIITVSCKCFEKYDPFFSQQWDFQRRFEPCTSVIQIPTAITLAVRFPCITGVKCRSQWPCRLRRRSAASRLLSSWVQIPTGTWMFVCCECCVLSGKGLCKRADNSSRVVLPTVVLRCVCSRNLMNEGGHGPLGGCRVKNKQWQ